jgi:hypothetical protein
MSLTNQQRLDTYRFFSIAFSAAPGQTYLAQMEEAYAAGLTTKQIVNIFTTKPQFLSVYPATLSNGEFANSIVENVVGNAATTAAKAEAKQAIVDALNIGWTRGDVIYQIFSNLGSKPANDATWGATAKLMQNRVEVALYATEVLGLKTTDLATLQNVIKAVQPGADTSSTDALKAILAAVGFNTGMAATSLTSGNDTYTAPTNSSGVAVNGGIGNDTITGSSGDDQLFGGSGNDVLNGGRGKDYIEGGDGADTIDLGAFYNTYYIYGYYDNAGIYHPGYWVYTVDANFEVADGGAGSDTIKGSYGSDLIYGGDGADLIYGDSGDWYIPFRVGQVRFSDASTAGRLFNDTIYGGGGDDRIYGGPGDDHLYGGDGNDTIYGGEGNDLIEGGAGNDTIYDSGVLMIFAGEGNDAVEVSLTDSTQKSMIDLGPGDDSLAISIEVDAAKLAIVAGPGADTIFVSNYTDAEVTLDLSESVQAQDVIVEPGFDIYKGTKPLRPVVVTGFDPLVDKLNVGYFDLYGRQYDKSHKAIDYYINSSGAISYYRNYVQKISSPTQAYQTTGTGVDAYGKGIFVITGASVASTDLATVAAFLDPYGNNATYGNKKSHIFVFNVAGQGLAVYRFTDDTGADNKIVADELTPLVLLTGVTAEQLDTTSYTFFLI